MSLLQLQDEWKRDSPIDQSDDRMIAIEVAKVPKLHSKYMNMLSSVNLQVKKLEADKKRLHKKLVGYYCRNIFEPLGREPFEEKVQTKSQVESYIEADDDMIELDLNIEEARQKALFLKEVIYHINQRTFLLKSYVDWLKFSKGMDL